MNDWMTEAARDIESIEEPSVACTRMIIAEHSPFKDGVAYMPVPRCETCAHFVKFSHYPLPEQPTCRMLGPHVTIHADFGCVQWKEK